MNPYLTLLFLLATLFLQSYSSPNGSYEACSKKLNCGSLGELSYPFYDGSTRPEYCGYPGFKIDCSQEIPYITISDQEYLLKAVNSPDRYTIRISRNDSWSGNCPDSLTNTTIDFSRFKFSSATQNITFFYSCIDGMRLALHTSCRVGSYRSTSGFYVTQAMMDVYKISSFPMCEYNLFLPVSNTVAEAINSGQSELGYLIAAFEEGFELGLIVDNSACDSCIKWGGVCGYNWDSKQFVCHCVDADYRIRCEVNSPPPGPKEKKILIITVGTGSLILGIIVLFFIYFLWRRKVSENEGLEGFLKKYESLAPRRYTYADIRKMTNSFKEKLGEGGYGTVFKGKLQDGRHVAVKVSKESKGDGHEFANEVVSICRTSHINIVPLLGFFFEGHKRALLYEFMPNGSLEKFIRRRDFLKNDPTLSFSKLFEIVVGIARGLEYLHRGCNTRIVHFDIKPHNILLDAEFTPKISDFGLAKRFKQKDSIISISGARGTAGYIAPEVFFSIFGGASHKSDVYSYGMMVLEIVGCTKRTEENRENSSELYFPRWIYKQLERGPTLDCGRILNEEEKELERKMVLVGLWCIQTSPRSRPSMHGVLGMLQGEVELQVPPMPSLSSPPRSQQPSEDPDSATFGLSTTYASSVVD